jgi:hypothetical protein
VKAGRLADKHDFRVRWPLAGHCFRSPSMQKAFGALSDFGCQRLQCLQLCHVLPPHSGLLSLGKL